MDQDVMQSQRHMCVYNLPEAESESAAARSRTHDLLLASPALSSPYHYATEPHNHHATTVDVYRSDLDVVN